MTIKIDFTKIPQKVGEYAEEVKEEAVELAHEAEQAIEEAVDHIPGMKRRRKLSGLYRFLKYFSLAAVGLSAVVIITFLLKIGPLQAIYTDAIGGKRDIDTALSLLEKQSFAEAAIYSRRAEEKFDSAAGRLRGNQEDWFFAKYGYFSGQFKDAVIILDTAAILSRALTEVCDFGYNMKQVLSSENKSFTSYTPEEKRAMLQILHESGPEIYGIKANIDLAVINLQQVRYSGMLLPLKPQMGELLNRLVEAQGILENAVPMSQLLVEVLGYPEKSTYLLILQNSDELRPTGGFIGTYGILETKDGDIVRLDTHDVYHLDMPVKDLISVEPPAPLKKYLIQKWYMRDSNWSPDWAVSAKQIEWFFKEEDRLLPAKNQINNVTGEFEGVIAITPKLVIDLLEYVGPITIEGEEYSQENFMDLLQYKVEKGYYELGVPSWQRKEVIGQIVNELKEKLLDLPPKEYYQIYGIIDRNLQEKNILVYFNDNEFQNLARESGWTGEVAQTDGDFLMVVDANMGALKTDAVMNRNIEYSVSRGSNGAYSDVMINYSHNGKVDWKTSRYLSYVRVYAPKGSELVESGGYKEGVTVSEELDKTVFGFFVTVEPGKIANVYLRYKLPENLVQAADNGEYSLYLQKQPGTKVEKVKIDIDWGNRLKSYSPTSFYAKRIGDNRIVWETDFTTDKEFGITMKK